MMLLPIRSDFEQRHHHGLVIWYWHVCGALRQNDSPPRRIIGPQLTLLAFFRGQQGLRSMPRNICVWAAEARILWPPWIQILAELTVKGILGGFDSSPTSEQCRSL